MGLKYISVDIETTGLDFDNHQIIEFAAIFEDPHRFLNFKEIPKFKRIIRHDIYKGSAFAINMNARIFKILAEYESKRGPEKEVFAAANGIIEPYELMPQFSLFVEDCYKHYDLKVPARGINVVGKNFAGFDGRFIEKLNPGLIKINHVVGDPATLYTDFYKDDSFAGLQTCKDVAGISGIVSHDALEDAWDVVRVLRKKY